MARIAASYRGWVDMFEKAKQGRAVAAAPGGTTMSELGHLWAIGYDDVARADQVRNEITELGWGAGKASKYLLLEDIAVVVRRPGPVIHEVPVQTDAGA